MNALGLTLWHLHILADEEREHPTDDDHDHLPRAQAESLAMSEPLSTATN